MGLQEVWPVCQGVKEDSGRMEPPECTCPATGLGSLCSDRCRLTFENNGKKGGKIIKKVSATLRPGSVGLFNK